MANDTADLAARQLTARVPVSFGASVHAYRLAHHLTVRELARETHLRPTTLYKWESGSSLPRPTSQTVRTWLRHVGAETVDAFIAEWADRAPDPPPLDPWNLALGQAVRTALLLALDAIEANDWPLALRYVDRALRVGDVALDTGEEDDAHV